MSDRDTLLELFKIVGDEVEEKNLAITKTALEYLKRNFNKGCDVYFRRRLSVCRMLLKFHLPIDNEMLDVLVSTSLCHFLPGDIVPGDHDDFVKELVRKDTRIADIFSTLKQITYSDKSYYSRLIGDKYALLIRLTERGVLVESLYEWSSSEAHSFINQTKENFFPLCIYAKEHFPEFGGVLTLLMEKTRNLISANEALLGRFDESEDALRSEIIFLKEENAALRAMISNMKH